MLPTLKPEQLVLACGFFRPHPGSLVVVRRGEIEIVKRLKEIKDDKIFVTGDNGSQSTDSLQFGWLSREAITATVIWPRKA